MPMPGPSRLLLPLSVVVAIVLPCLSLQQATARVASARLTRTTAFGQNDNDKTEGRKNGLADPNTGDRGPPSVLCVGETLYDSLPEAIFLGGAPTNVAVHLASLGTPAAVVTCVGSDRLGHEAIRRLEARGVDTRYVQRHAELGTGMVTASLDARGDAAYAFDTPAAWDGIVATDELRGLVGGFGGWTIMGTLASRLGDVRGATSAAAIRELRNLARDDSVVLDVNLRHPWYGPSAVLALARGGGDGDCNGTPLALLKLNEEELPLVEEWCGLPSSDALSGSGLRDRMAALGASLCARRVCVTRGGAGAALLCGDRDDTEVFAECGGRACVAESGGDSVGAGDAFLAALVRSLLLGDEPAARALDRACALGGYVATRRGAVPDHDEAPDELREVFSFA